MEFHRISCTGFILVSVLVFFNFLFTSTVALPNPEFDGLSDIPHRRKTSLDSHLEQNEDIPDDLNQFESPDFLKLMLSSALSSFGQISSGGLFSSGRPRVQFAKSEDGSILLAKVVMPQSSSSNVQKGAERNVFVSVNEHSQLELRVEMQNGPFQSTFNQVVSLPHRVSKDSVKISPAENGDILIRMNIIGSDTGISNLSRHSGNSDLQDQNPLNALNAAQFLQLFDSMQNSAQTDHDQSDYPGSAKGQAETDPDLSKPFLGEKDHAVQQQLPSAAHVERCHAINGKDELKYQKCLCDVLSSSSQQLVCYTKFASNAINEARRVHKDDFAIKLKEMAIKCTNTSESSTQCMERLASHIITSVLENINDTEMVQLREKLRRALENDDMIGRDAFQSSNTFGIILGAVLGAILLSACFWGGMVYAMRRGWFGHRVGGLLSHLSSALTQTNLLFEGRFSKSKSDVLGSGSRAKSVGKSS